MKENRRLSSLEKLAVILSVAFLVIVAAALAFFFKPLGEPMELAKSDPQAAQAVGKVENQVSSVSKAQEVCGNTGSLLVLFTGEDFTRGVWPLGADTVRVVQVNFSDRKIVVVGFPRDLWVKTPGLEELDYPETRLGLAYHYKKEGTSGSDKHKVTTATEQVAQALYDNFDLEPETYFTVQLKELPGMINTIGGVDVDVPQAFTNEYGVEFTAGMQHMNGQQVTEYVRSWAENQNEGDMLRFPRQNLLIMALQDQVLNADLLPKIPDLYKQYDKAIVTDLSPNQIKDIACMIKEVPQQEIEFHEIDIESGLVTEGEDFVLMPKVDEIKAKLSEWLGE
jgi:LCP family protein required for cell wall assembly